MDRELLVQALGRLSAPLDRRDAVREDEDVDGRLRREKSLRKILGGGDGTAIDARKRVRPAAPDPRKICEDLLRALLVPPHDCHARVGLGQPDGDAAPDARRATHHDCRAPCEVHPGVASPDGGKGHLEVPSWNT